MTFDRVSQMLGQINMTSIRLTPDRVEERKGGGGGVEGEKGE